MRNNRIDGITRERGDTRIIGMKCVVALFFTLLFTLFAGCGSDRALTFEESLVAEESTDGESLNADPVDGDAEEKTICVHVCGAVRAPGLKVLPEGSRVWDALEAAGGFTENADEAYVNLAAFAQDGQKLYFPTVEEAQALKTAADDHETAKVDLNAADETRLCELPGIGSSRAKAILKYRAEHGKFQNIEELLNVPGIKEGLFEQIKDLVVAG